MVRLEKHAKSSSNSSAQRAREYFLSREKAISNLHFRKLTHFDKSLEVGLEGSKAGGKKTS